MVAFRKTLFSTVAAAALTVLATSAAYALPALQLGPGVGTWQYDTTTQTWVTNTNPFSVNAYANDTTANGGNGDYAWDPAGAAAQIGYVVISAAPKINFDGFDISVMNDGGSLSLLASGFGAPPASDPNSLAPHGIFDTWFEIYEFNFDGTATTISDQQPGQTGTGQGFVEEIAIQINSLVAGVSGIHIDLFTVQGDGLLDSTTDLVKSFAPFSHDVENGPCCTKVPEPAPMAVFGFGLVALAWVRRRYGVSRVAKA